MPGLPVTFPQHVALPAWCLRDCPLHIPSRPPPPRRGLHPHSAPSPSLSRTRSAQATTLSSHPTLLFFQFRTRRLSLSCVLARRPQTADRTIVLALSLSSYLFLIRDFAIAAHIPCPKIPLHLSLHTRTLLSASLRAPPSLHGECICLQHAHLLDHGRPDPRIKQTVAIVYVTLISIRWPCCGRFKRGMRLGRGPDQTLIAPATDNTHQTRVPALSSGSELN